MASKPIILGAFGSSPNIIIIIVMLIEAAVLSAGKVDDSRDDERSFDLDGQGFQNVYQVVALRPRNIVQLLRNIEAANLLNMIFKAGLQDVLEDGGGPTYTLFAPTDEAFRNMIGFDRWAKDDLKRVLMQHLVPGRFRFVDLRPGTEMKNLAGGSLTVLETRSDGLTINGVPVLLQYSDHWAQNGVVHVIDGLLFPVPALNNPPSVKPGDLNQADPMLIRRTDSGKVRGKFVKKNMVAWQGIPYAEPPLGRLRFQPPRAPLPWGQIVRNAKNLPNACYQAPDTTFGDFDGTRKWNPNTRISEDCLYLSVYAPANASQPLPVLVWIHGGGYTTGSASLDQYDPTAFLDKGEVVFVSLQYRLNAFGFLYMGQNSGAPGNVGLMDQVMALKWVRNNVREFGGDPDRVTIMGQDAGANSVALHLVSPMSCYLFNKAIMQSVGLNARWAFVDPDEALKRSVVLAEAVKCSAGRTRDPVATVDCLRTVPTSQLVEALSSVDNHTLNFHPFVPTVDGRFLPAAPSVLLSKGFVDKTVPVLLGSNRNEGFRSLMYVLTDLMPNRELEPEEKDLSSRKYEQSVDSVFAFHPAGVRSLIALHYDGLPECQPKPFRLFNAMDQMVGDSDFACSVEDFAEKLSEAGNPVYRYFYNHQSSRDPWPSWSGVKHGDEVEMTFGRPLLQPRLYTSDEVSFANSLLTYWTNFVKTGSPNPSNSMLIWPRYKSPEWKYLNLTVGLTSLQGASLLSRQCKLWNRVLPHLVRPVAANLEEVGDSAALERLACSAQQ